MSDKVRNTLKMMGVSSKDALFFVDALELYPLTINPTVKQAMIDIILNTKVMDKTFRQWFELFVKESKNSGVRFEFIDVNLKSSSRPYKITDFDLTRIEKPNVMILLDLILQMYYRKEKILG